MQNTIARLKAIPFLAGLLLALWTGCADRPPRAATEGTGGARSGLGPANAGDVLVIDDFRTGPDLLEVNTVGREEHGRAGASILGGMRCTDLYVDPNPFGRPARVEIRDGFLALDTGAGANHSVMLLYGYDLACNGVGLNADLSHLTGFRIEFATDFASGAYGALDLDTAGGIAVWTDSGSASVPLGITAGSTEMYVPFADIRGEVPPDWQHVQEIAIVIESGGIVPAHDYVLRSISAVAQQ